jgi:GNAT superfamily N-acetyltransferase
LDLNPEATLQARASILQELYRDYNLDSLLEEYPETRVRFFIMTCFKATNPDLTVEFQNMIHDMRQKKLSPRNLHDRIKTIQTTIKLNDDEKFFLARMLFPHLDPADYVELVTTAYGEEDKLDLVFQTEGNDGQIYRIRPPFLPKEIAQFHSLMSESALVGTFTAQHDFLFIFNARNRLVGGLYWRNTMKNRIHLEWIVIRERYQNLSLSKRILDDFYERMRNRGIQIITVGFYLERFFFKQGFEIDSHYGGLVKNLD